MKRGQISAWALLGALALCTSGCSAPTAPAATGLATLERAATEADRLPEGVTLGTPGELEDSSVRLVADTADNRIFAGYTKDKSRVCAAYYPAKPDQGWFGGCSALAGPDQLLSMSGIGYKQSMILVKDAAATNDLEANGWDRLNENVLIPAP